MTVLLADRLRAGGQPPAWDTNGTLGRTLADHAAALAHIPIVDVTNVADLVWNSGDVLDITNGDLFPCITPPFPELWLEFSRPATINTPITSGSTAGWASKRYGAHVTSTPVADGWLVAVTGYVLDADKGAVGPVATWEGLVDRLGMIVDVDTDSTVQPTTPVKRGDTPEETELRAHLDTLGWRDGMDPRTLTAEQARQALPLVERLIRVSSDRARTLRGESRRLHRTAEQVRMLSEATPVFLPTALKALCFMNCKNVEQDAREPERKLSRRFEKRHGEPLLTYRVLRIRPMSRAASATADGDGSGGTALHIARGHFKDFRDGPGLFGKYRGVYWWDAQVRGSRDNGVAVKDYRLEPSVS